jgi:hypothetical protein
LAWTRNTDWFADQSVTRPAASTSASAPQGSIETCACAWVSKMPSTTTSHRSQAAPASPSWNEVREQRLPDVPASNTRP